MNVKNTAEASLESILRRSDVWRGGSKRFALQHTLDTGHLLLNRALLGKGWPLGSLLEVCQPVDYGYSEWQLFSPALKGVDLGYIVLLNPPAMPFSQGMLQMGLDLNRIVVVQSADKPRFLKNFVELARAKMCRALLAWSPHKTLSYTDLRKCLLAVSAGSLAVLFRHQHALHQNSPASLRIACCLKSSYLSLDIYKQKGLLLKKSQVIHLPVAPPQGAYWQGVSTEEKISAVHHE